MRETGKTILVSALILISGQILSLLFGFNNSLMLLASSFTLVIYLENGEYIEREEAILGGSVFIISSIVTSAIGRITSYERFCQGATDPVRPLCAGYIEWWLNFFVTDLSFNWPYWVLFAALGAVSVIIYREYR